MKAYGLRSPFAVLCALAVVGVFVGVGMYAEAPLARLAAALGTVYVCGYVTGALLVEPQVVADSLAWGVIRTAVGLFLASVAFLLALVFHIPWFHGPLTLAVSAVVWRGSAACVLPRPAQLQIQSCAAALLGVLVVGPVLVSCLLMSRGPFPPVFFNVDTPYFLQLVQALIHANSYPPPSLANLGGLQTYHMGIHGIAALLSRVSGLPAHHATFLMVIPLLSLASVASATAIARMLSPGVPLWLGVPLLLAAVPSFWYGFWARVGPRLMEASAAGRLYPLQNLFTDYEMWGVVSIAGQNVGGQFVALAGVAGLLAVGRRGWRLPLSLIGMAIMAKVSMGIALVAGLIAHQGWRTVAERRIAPLIPACLGLALFGATYLAFFVLPPAPVAFTTEISPFFHLQRVRAGNGPMIAGVPSFAVDLVWLLLPALIVGWRGAGAQGTRWSLLFMGLAPFAVVNLTRSIDIRPGAGGVSDDWIQILFAAPLLLHVFVLAAVNERWASIGRLRRGLAVVAILTTVIPVAAVAASYIALIVSDPSAGHEFVDNRAIAGALQAIPTANSVIVTNDLNYRGKGFARDDRQMQIPSLFGHQAFAANYKYEIFTFSQERLGLQALLSRSQWSDEITDAARTFGWTHFLVRKEFVHPEPNPLRRIYETDSYSVYLFVPK